MLKFLLLQVGIKYVGIHDYTANFVDYSAHEQR